MLSKIVFIFSIGVLVAYCQSQGQQCKKEIAPMENYDKSKMKNVWFVVEVGDENKSKKRCMTCLITEKGGNSVLKEVGFIGNKPDVLDVSIKHIKGSEYIAKSSEFPATPAYVISTDYRSYATWFLCRNGHPQDGVVFVTARDRNPSEEVLKKAHDSITKAGLKIDQENLFPVDHSNCSSK